MIARSLYIGSDTEDTKNYIQSDIPQSDIPQSDILQSDIPQSDIPQSSPTVNLNANEKTLDDYVDEMYDDHIISESEDDVEAQEDVHDMNWKLDPSEETRDTIKFKDNSRSNSSDHSINNTVTTATNHDNNTRYNTVKSVHGKTRTSYTSTDLNNATSETQENVEKEFVYSGYVYIWSIFVLSIVGGYLYWVFYGEEIETDEDVIFTVQYAINALKRK
jgi:hypothetical protein